MARTYSFDHFTVPQSAEPAQPDGEKARVAGKRGARGDGRPRYGKRFAQTEELVHVHQMNQQLEELAGLGAPKLSTPREPERAERPERQERQEKQERRVRLAEPLYQGPPIGAIPSLRAARPPPPDTLRDLVGTGARHLRLLRHCIVDGVAASYRLAKLPLQAAKLTARTLRAGLALFRPLESMEPLQSPRPSPT